MRWTHQSRIDSLTMEQLYRHLLFFLLFALTSHWISSRLLFIWDAMSLLCHCTACYWCSFHVPIISYRHQFPSGAFVQPVHIIFCFNELQTGRSRSRIFSNIWQITSNKFSYGHNYLTKMGAILKVTQSVYTKLIDTTCYKLLVFYSDVWDQNRHGRVSILERTYTKSRKSLLRRLSNIPMHESNSEYIDSHVTLLVSLWPNLPSTNILGISISRLRNRMRFGEKIPFIKFNHT